MLLTYFTFFKRIDIVFDVYLPNSLKAATREKRGRGVRKRVSAENKCPSNWLQFLKDAMNKKELNKFFAETLSALTYPSERQLIVTYRAIQLELLCLSAITRRQIPRFSIM